MSTSYFNEVEKLEDSSNFVTWKIRLEIIADDNDVWEYIQGEETELMKNAPVVAKNKYKTGELKAKKIIVDGLQDHLLA